MRSSKRVKVGDREVNVREEDFSIVTEEWNEYKLLDGGKIRVKTTVGKILRMLDEDDNPVYDKEGDPSFVVKHSTQVVSSS